MKVRSMNLINFRCFEETTVNFNEHYNVFVGNNGAGKSTILDALAIGVGSFLSGFSAVKGSTIHIEDATYKTTKLGSRIEWSYKFPVEISINGEIMSENMIWKHSLNGIGRRTTYGDAKNIISVASRLQDEIKQDDIDTILPIIAYYGTGRLWMQKKQKRVVPSKSKKWNRLDGYQDCLDVASNEKLMMNWFMAMTFIQLQENETVPELEAVKNAMETCYKNSNPNIEEVNIRYSVKNSEMEIIVRNNQGKVDVLPLKSLSDGIKSTISMVGDIAYRMAVLNPQLLNNILTTPGVIMIDEIDMHLHPEWQKKIIHDLTTIFPNAQFFFTTHSPSVLANVESKHVQILEEHQIYPPSRNTYGSNVDEILIEVMKSDVKPQDISSLIEQFDEEIDNHNLKKAKDILNKMVTKLGENNSDVIKAQIEIDLLEMDDDIL